MKKYMSILITTNSYKWKHRNYVLYYIKRDILGNESKLTDSFIVHPSFWIRNT